MNRCHVGGHGGVLGPDRADAAAGQDVAHGGDVQAGHSCELLVQSRADAGLSTVGVDDAEQLGQGLFGLADGDHVEVVGQRLGVGQAAVPAHDERVDAGDAVGSAPGHTGEVQKA